MQTTVHKHKKDKQKLAKLYGIRAFGAPPEAAGHPQHIRFFDSDSGYGNGAQALGLLKGGPPYEAQEHCDSVVGLENEAVPTVGKRSHAVADDEGAGVSRLKKKHKQLSADIDSSTPCKGVLAKAKHPPVQEGEGALAGPAHRASKKARAADMRAQREAAELEASQQAERGAAEKAARKAARRTKRLAQQEAAAQAAVAAAAERVQSEQEAGEYAAQKAQQQEAAWTAAMAGDMTKDTASSHEHASGQRGHPEAPPQAAAAGQGESAGLVLGAGRRGGRWPKEQLDIISARVMDFLETGERPSHTRAVIELGFPPTAKNVNSYTHKFLEMQHNWLAYGAFHKPNKHASAAVLPSAAPPTTATMQQVVTTQQAGIKIAPAKGQWWPAASVSLKPFVVKAFESFPEHEVQEAAVANPGAAPHLDTTLHQPRKSAQPTN